MPVAALVGGAFALGSAAIGKKSQKNANETNIQLAREQNEFNQAQQAREFAFNKQQSDLAYERDLANWHMQNEYNTPQAQLERYKEAGLNPNLIYGNGTSSAGQASAPPTYTPARYNAAKGERATVQAEWNPSVDPFQAISLTNQLAIQKAQRDQINAQTDFTKQQTINSGIEELSKTLNLDIGKQTKDVAIEQIRENLNNTRARTDNLGQEFGRIVKQTELTGYQIDKVKQEINNLKTVEDLNKFNMKLRQIGVTDKDHLLTRFAARFLLEHGINF